jgi:hypothetical protein
VNFMSACGAIKYEFFMSLSRDVVSHIVTHIQSDENYFQFCIAIQQGQQTSISSLSVMSME